MEKAKGHTSLFRPGPNSLLNACVGRNGGPAGFNRYARGYFEAGARLLASLQENALGIDLVVYPLVNTYRHGIEAALKYLVRVLPFVCDEKAEVKLTHKLMDNWKAVRRYLWQLEVPRADLDQVEQTLDEFVEIDPNGEVFRYPESRDGELHLQATTHINVEVFGEGMAFVAKSLEDWWEWAEYLHDNKREAERDAAGW